MDEISEIRDVATRDALVLLAEAQLKVISASKMMNALTNGRLPHYRDYEDITDAIENLYSVITKYREERGLF